MSTVYKVVRVSLRQKDEIDNERITSCFTPGGWEIEYPIGRTVLPSIPGSYLYAFSSLEAAKHYIAGPTVLSDSAVLRVYSAEASVVPMETYYYSAWNELSTFWSEQWWLFGEGFPHVMEDVPGTVWCNSLKLLEVEATDGRTLKARKQKQSSPFIPGVKPERIFR